MIVLLGSTGYVGSQFAAELECRGWPFVGLSRSKVDYTRFDVLRNYLAKTRPEFVINAAGYTGKPNVDACELRRAETLQGNTLFPAALAHACEALDVPFGQVSSGCIYNGAKVTADGQERVEPDLTAPGVRQVIDKHPEAVRGFTEEDEPNFTFRRPPCSFYSGTKALAEESIHGMGRNYLWRLRIPFDREDNPRNYLSKVQNYAKVYDNLNSLSHRSEFVQACLDLWANRAPFGIYNLTNPGFISARRVIDLIREILKPNRAFDFWAGDDEFYRLGAKTPRSNCVLDASKALAAGAKLRLVEDALRDSLEHWKRLAA